MPPICDLHPAAKFQPPGKERQAHKEFIELTDYLAPEGRPIPVDMRSNDRWFQHIAIVVSDMDKAYQRLRELKVQHASTGPQRIPD